MKDSKIRDKLKKLTEKWDKNVGPFDSRTRILTGSILVFVVPLQELGYFQIPLFSAIGAMFAGGILVVEGLTCRCVLYSLLGIDRYPVEESEPED